MLAINNRLNNRIIRQEEERIVTAEITEMVNRSRSHFQSALRPYSHPLFSFAAEFPTSAWFSTASITAQLQGYQNHPRIVKLSDQTTHNWENVLQKNVVPFCAQIARGNGTSLSMETLQTASISMTAVRHFTEESLLHSTASTRSAHFHTLLAHSYMWAWLENTCAYYSQPDVFMDTESNSWICKLARRLHTAIKETRQSTIILQPSDFISHLPSDPDTIHLIGNREYDNIDQPSVLQQQLYIQMKRILQKWLGFPQDVFADGRGWTLQILQAMFGTGVFLLDECWSIYLYFSRHVLQRPSKNVRTVFMHQLFPFFHEIRHCDATPPDSDARRHLDEIMKHHCLLFPQDAPALRPSSHSTSISGSSMDENVCGSISGAGYEEICAEFGELIL